MARILRQFRCCTVFLQEHLHMAVWIRRLRLQSDRLWVDYASLTSLSYLRTPYVCTSELDVREILRCFGKVGKLTVYCIPWDLGPDLTEHDPHPPAIDPPVIQELELHDTYDYSKVAISTLSKSLGVASVRALTLVLESMDRWQLELYDEFIKLLSPTLKRLCIYYSFDRPGVCFHVPTVRNVRTLTRESSRTYPRGERDCPLCQARRANAVF